MAKMQWDQVGDREYQVGVDHVALYPQVSGTYPTGVPWNGVTTITESPSGAEASPFYADNMKYLNLLSAEDFAASIEAYTWPTEFEECDGSRELADGIRAGQQPRKPFGLAYRTRIGNDVSADSYGYIIHVIYGCLAAPTEKAHATVNDSPEPGTFSWDISTSPIEVPNLERPTATLEFDSTKVSVAGMAAVEALLYGDASSEGSLPLPAALLQAVADADAPTPPEEG